MYRKLPVIALTSILLAVTADSFAASKVGTVVKNKLSRSGQTRISAGRASADAELGAEFREGPEVDAEFHRLPGGVSTARVRSTGVPRPADNGIVAADAGVTGFPGLSQREQRMADDGNQFSIEPPDVALAVGGNFVMNAVNTALAVYDKTGQLLAGPTALNPFFGLPSAIQRDPQTGAPLSFGPFISDPKCLYDASLGRWFVTVLEVDVDSATGGFTDQTAIYIAVSKTADPTGDYWIFRLDTSANGLPDQPLIGVDANGFYISVNAFSLSDDSFLGGQIYALSKAALAAGSLGPVVLLDGLTQAEGPGYSIQPANIPAGGAFAAENGGTEYFLSALDFNATLDNRITAWAVTGTSSLNTGTPVLEIQNVVLDSQVYGQPPAAQQRPGPTPLADLLRSGVLGLRSPEQIQQLSANDDRMNDVTFAAGHLWGAVNTVVKPPNGPTRVGLAYFIVAPSWNAGVFSASIARQNYISVNQQNVLFPALGVNNSGKGIIAFTLAGPNHFPSAAYAPLSLASGAGAVRIAAAGVEPQDGFTGYRAFYGTSVARWGDYHTAVADSDGSIWFATECNLGGPRTLYANWSTFIGHVSP